jgi:hypothetical protein
VGPKNETVRMPGATPSSAQMPTPSLRLVYRLQAQLDALLDLGQTPAGHRRIIA